jgi:membrane-associated phospholipid phosphatase
MFTRKFTLFLGLFIFMNTMNVKAQIDSATVIKKPMDLDLEKYKTKLGPSLIIPGILIGYGLTTMGDNGLYSSKDAQRDITRAFPGFSNSLDDVMLTIPYAQLVALNLMKVKCTNDWINTSLLIVKSELLMSAIVFPVKAISNRIRPDSSNYESFPSGHTAQAFVAATVIHKEYRRKSNWYGIASYGIATTVGVFRMLNNKHWQSDVLVGAGIGILAANLTYATHKHKWGRMEYCINPIYQPNMKGLGMVCQF